MILDQVNPYEVKKFNNTQGSAYPAGAPLAQQNGVGNQLKDAVISQGVNQMAGSMMGAGASGAAGAAAMNPYTLPIMLGMSMLNEGGQVGPLGTQYAADGDKIDRNKQYTEDQQMNNYKEMIRQQMYNKSIMGQNPTRGINKADAARAAFTTDPILSKMYGVGKAPSDSGMYDLSVFQGLFPIDDKGYTARGYDQGGQIDPINQILDEIEAEEASQMVEGAIGPSQAMQFPLARPANLMQEDMPEGRDRTYSPYEMLRPDNFPNT